MDASEYDAYKVGVDAGIFAECPDAPGKYIIAIKYRDLKNPGSWRKKWIAALNEFNDEHPDSELFEPTRDEAFNVIMKQDGTQYSARTFKDKVWGVFEYGLLYLKGYY